MVCDKKPLRGTLPQIHSHLLHLLLAPLSLTGRLDRWPLLECSPERPSLPALQPVCSKCWRADLHQSLNDSQLGTSIKLIISDSSLQRRHATQRSNSSNPSQAALVKLKWGLTFSRISYFLPVFIRNLGHDSSSHSRPRW